MPAALFGITNDTVSLVVNLLILFGAVLWLALVAWTYFDAKRRIEDGFLVTCATVAAFIFPFVGAVVYSILRPPEYLDDAHERRLEIRAAELRVRHLEEHSCPHCEYPVERSFLRCPSCKTRIKDPCESCGKPIDPRWALCPYCETPVRRQSPPERERRRPGRRSQRSGRAGGADSGAQKSSSGPPSGQKRPEKRAEKRGTTRSEERPTRATPRSSGSS